MVQLVAPSLRNVPHNPLQDLARNRWDAVIFAFVVMIAGRRARGDPARLRAAPLRAVPRRRRDGLVVFSLLFGLGHLEQGRDVALATAVARRVLGRHLPAAAVDRRPDGRPRGVQPRAGGEVSDFGAERGRVRRERRRSSSRRSTWRRRDKLARPSVRCRASRLALARTAPVASPGLPVSAVAAGRDDADLFVRRDPVLRLPALALVRPRPVVRERYQVLLRSRDREVGRVPRDVPGADDGDGAADQLRDGRLRDPVVAVLPGRRRRGARTGRRWTGSRSRTSRRSRTAPPCTGSSRSCWRCCCARRLGLNGFVAGAGGLAGDAPPLLYVRRAAVLARVLGVRRWRSSPTCGCASATTWSTRGLSRSAPPGR